MGVVFEKNIKKLNKKENFAFQFHVKMNRVQIRMIELSRTIALDNFRAILLSGIYFVIQFKG